MAISSYSIARALLKEKYALNAKTTQEALLDSRTCLRYFPGIPMGKVSECLDCLRTIASVKNTKASHTVLNPQVNKEELPGTWRHVQEYAEPPRAKSEPDVQDVYQLLKLGWAQTLIDSEAHLVGGDNIPLQPERILVRQYVGLDFTKLGDMIEGIESTKYVTNPVIEGKTYDGPIVAPATTPSDLKWRILSSKPSRDPDGSGIITQTLAKNLVQTPDELPTAILLSDDKALLSPFAHDTTSEKNIYVWEYRWIDPAYAQTLRDTIALTSDVIDAKAIKADDGSFNIQVLTHTNTWKGTLSQVWGKETVSPTFAAEKVVESFSHIPLTSLDAFKATLGTATSGYKVSSVKDSTDEERGFARITQTQDKLFSGAVTANNGTLNEEEYLFLITGGILRTTMWLGVKDDDLATAMATVATAPTGYSVVKVANNYNGTGSFTLTRTMMVKGSDTVPVKIKVEFPSFEDERRTYFYFGLDKTDATALLTTLLTTCDEGYKVDLAEIQEWRYGMLVVIQQISKLNLLLTGRVQSYDYTKTFGLVNVATTIYPNIAVDSITALKVTILADATKIMLNLWDDDAGQGKANVTAVWRSKEEAPRALGAIRSTKNSQFHKEAQDRLWIDINLTDKDALATAVALAMAGTDPYAVAEGAEIREVTGEDAGDKTARIRQHVVKEGTPDPADYSMQESFNPHGLQEAVMIVSVREYPEVDYTQVGTVFALLQTFLGDPGKGRIQVSMNGNGTFTMRALKEGTPDWDNTTPDYVQTGIHNKGLIGEGKTQLATGVKVASAAAIVADVTADDDYALEDVQMDERGMGEAAITKRQTKKSETAVQVSETPAAGLRRAVKDNNWPLVLAANVATVWTAASTEGVAGNYVLHFRQKNILGNGMFSISNQVVECVEKIIAEYTAGYADDSITTIKEVRDAAALPDATDTTGTTETVKGGLNLFNKYDYIKVTITARTPKSFGESAVTYDTLGGWYGIGLWRIRYHHTINYHTTATAAATALANGWIGSGISSAGNNLWQSHKVIRDDIYTG